MTAAQGDGLTPLLSAIRDSPIVDNHAHNLLLLSHLQSYPFHSVTSEARNGALEQTFKSLPHLRAEKQLRQLFSCGDEADWEAILQARNKWLSRDPESLIRKCLEGTHCILMDDGLDGAHQVHRYDSHDKWTSAPTKRIVRIETVAEQIIEALLKPASRNDLDTKAFAEKTWLAFAERFERAILAATEDSEVAAFKSVICYRTGLEIEPDLREALRKVGSHFEHFVADCIRDGKFRIQDKPLNDYVVLKTLEIIAESPAAKPIQFHTGLGDSDINLVRANPAYMQPLIEQYFEAPFVLLHSAYPYTREGGYLAMAYQNVYLDIGEVFPMVSREGQVSILKQAFEIVPGSKLLYSTDGHWFPETYWLANQQFRAVLEEVLIGFVSRKDLTVPQAVSLAEDILFNNSNSLYRLNHVLERGMRRSSQELTQSNESTSKTAMYNVTLAERFFEDNPGIEFVYLQWLDSMSILRTRVIPVREFSVMIEDASCVGISLGTVGILQDDTVTSAGSTAGQIYVEPDLGTLRLTHKKDPLRSATVLGCWKDKNGQDIPYCPRGALKHLLGRLSSEHSTTLLVGFEIEVTFLNRVDPGTNDGDPYAPITDVHAWSTLHTQQSAALPMLAEIATALAAAGIRVQQFHAESAAGQFEFVLGPLPALAAVDALIQARQTVAQVAATHGLRATLHPQPFRGLGTAAHAHVSLHPPGRDAQFFVGGVLAHLPAVCAFGMAEGASYARVVDDHWTGGTWVAWGTQNRETPLRRVGGGRWEVRCLDGTANMYLALGAVVAAGLLGLEAGESEFESKDCLYNPSQISDEQRAELGITRRLPKSLDESLAALEKDVELRAVLADEISSKYLIMKRAEQEKLSKLSEADRRVWLIERY